MIAVSAGVVACLSGWRGDRLFVAVGGGPLLPVAELGWDARAQTTPQRRLLLHGDEILVLEPQAGHLLLPPLRVRRYDLRGHEIAREEGADSGPATLSYVARREGDRSRVVRCGIDAASGRPTVEEETLHANLPGRRTECSGIPLLAGGAFHYPVRMRGLFRGANIVFRGDPAPPQLVGGDVVCAGNRRGRPGVWRAGAWHRLPGQRLFPDWRAPMGPLVVPCGNGIIALRREGGELPGLDAPPARLPPGIYAGLVLVEGHPWALAESETPTLARVGFVG